MPTPAFYAQPFPTEAEADRHAARERVKSTLELLRAEVELPSRSLSELLMVLDEAAEWVRHVRGDAADRLLGELRELKTRFASSRGHLPKSVTLRRDVQARLLSALTRCDRALAAWAGEVGE